MGPESRHQITHNEGASRAEGERAAGVEVGGVEGYQDTNKVETLCLGERETVQASGTLAPDSRPLEDCSLTRQ